MRMTFRAAALALSIAVVTAVFLPMLNIAAGHNLAPSCSVFDADLA